MGVTININGLSLCHKGSGGFTAATSPDVCLTPPVPSPVPYPNFAFSTDLAGGTTTVFADGGNMIAHKPSNFATSTGDEPGTAGGVASGTFMLEASWITFSSDVRIEGENACRLTDKMFHNHANTSNCGGELQPPVGGPGSPFCLELLAQILDLIWRNKHVLGGGGTHGLAHRFTEQINGQNGPGTDSWNTHDQTIKNQQRGLRNRLDDWNKNNCGPPPPSAWEWATKPAPVAKQWVNPNPVVDPTTAATVVGGTVVAVGAGYLIYRGIRMLPSLFPPLWWTIPANAAIP